jgi:hypothetical protein
LEDEDADVGTFPVDAPRDRGKVATVGDCDEMMAGKDDDENEDTDKIRAEEEAGKEEGG